MYCVLIAINTNPTSIPIRIKKNICKISPKLSSSRDIGRQIYTAIAYIVDMTPNIKNALESWFDGSMILIICAFVFDLS